MNKVIKIPAIAFLGILVAHSACAGSDFDNLEIPPGTPARFVGGCGKVVKFDQVTNVRPRYTDRRPDQGQINGVGSGSDIAQVLSVIPGVGAIAAVVGGAASAIVANAAINTANKEIDETAEREKKWDKVYLVTVKPDFGAEYTVAYEKINQSTPDVGDVVRMSSDARDPSGGDKFKLIFLGTKDLGEIGSEKYLTSCYASYANGKTAYYSYRQLSYNGTEFEWKKLDPKIQPSADAYFAKKAAEEAQKKADAAEAAKYNESR